MIAVSKLTIACIFISLASCGKDNTASNPADLEKNLTKLQKEIDFPGFSVAVFNEKEILFQQGFGLANKSTKQKFTTETIQPIASVSKTFVAVSLMKAIEQGYFTLETDINTILPFKIVNPNFPTDVIKIKHLVAHTSGLLDPEQATRISQSYEQGKKPTTELKDFIYQFYNPAGKYYSVKNFDKNKVGTTFNYSNFATALTAYLIEIKSGKSFAEYSQFIFNQLNMTSTHWFYNDALSSKYAALYDSTGKEYPIYTEKDYPSSTLRTNTKDLATFMIEMIKGYAGQSTLLTSPSFATMFSDQYANETSPANMIVTEPKRCVFWAIGRTGRILHTGGDGGVSAFVSFDPVKKVGRLLLINTEIDESKILQKQMESVLKELQKYEATL